MTIESMIRRWTEMHSGVELTVNVSPALYEKIMEVFLPASRFGPSPYETGIFDCMANGKQITIERDETRTGMSHSGVIGN